jgi:UDPglucose 6-dehydrogenase
VKRNIFFLCISLVIPALGYDITVIGTGYVGLVTGASLANFGHVVRCVDIDQGKIDALTNGHVPFYEPGLGELVHTTMNSGTLSFSADIPSAIRTADIIFIAVGTPMLSDGSADITAIFKVLDTISGAVDDQKHRVICMKSTVPIGTSRTVQEKLAEQIDPRLFSLVSNPEFLREGSALKDCAEPERIVIGTNSELALIIMKDLYQPLLNKKIPLVVTDTTTAETIKYASNAFLAVKISYINEIANLCEKTGANVFEVAHGMGLDSRIGNKFLKPGPGFGGSCFPKDSHALIKKAEEVSVPMRIVTAALEANDFQKKQVVEKLSSMLDDNLQGKTIAVLGLAFKANTDDVRDSAAIDIIHGLIAHGAHVQAYDPLANETMKRIIPDIQYAHSLKEAVTGCDAVVILTEWDEFGRVREELPQKRKHIPILDTRNILE